MTTFEQDQEHGNRWNGFLDFDSFFGPTTFCAHNNQGSGCIYHDQCQGEYHYGDRNFVYMKNNELNQELAIQDFSRLAVEEATESSCAEEDQLHSSHPPADWIVAPYTNYWPAHEASDEVADDIEPSTSCSSPGERSFDDEDYSSYLELTDDSSIDGELGKRINQMVPVPHVPRINGEIPSVDEATSDHQRLLDRWWYADFFQLSPILMDSSLSVVSSEVSLEVYDLVERKVQGDGNCQFRALSDQFYRSPEHHKFVRQQVVNQLKANPEDYEGYVPMEYDEYLQKISKVGEWGDHVTLQAAADSYGVKIFVITSFKDTCYIEILPKDEKSKRVIFLSFWAEVHYNSIYPHGESPPGEFSRKKKKWWQFRHKH